MPRQYSPQFRQRVLSLLAEGRSVGQLASWAQYLGAG